MIEICPGARGGHPSPRRLTFAVVAVVLAASALLVAPFGAVDAQEAAPHSLGFVGEQEGLDLTVEPSIYREAGLYRISRMVGPNPKTEAPRTETVRASVVVHNRGEELDHLRFSAATVDGTGRIRSDGEQDGKDGVAVNITWPRDAGDRGIGAFEKKRFELAISVEDPPQELTGQLLVNAVTEEGEEGEIIPGVAQGALPLKVSERVPPALGNDSRFNRIWGTCLALSTALVLLRYLWTSVQPREWLGAGLEWDPKGNWASTFTTGGGLVGALLANGVLPEEGTTFLTKGEYSALTVFFAVLVIFGALFYNATRTKKATQTQGGEDEDQMWGRAWTFLVAMWVTMWAAFGQLVTVFLILFEMKLEGDMTRPAIVILALVFLSAGIFMARRAWKTMGDSLEGATPAAGEEGEGPGVRRPQSLPSVHMP